jgi:hypothetical protein
MLCYATLCYATLQVLLELYESQSPTQVGTYPYYYYYYYFYYYYYYYYY